MDPILSSAIKPIVTVVAKKALDALVSNLASKDAKAESDIATDLFAHFQEVVTWSERIEFYGVSQAFSVDESTIALDIALSPRRFVGPRADREWTEEHILASTEHHVLLGDPGAGKTTTIKRLCRKLFTSSPISQDDQCQYPIVVRLRTLRDTESLYERLCKALGIRWRLEPDEGPKSEQRQMVGDLEILDALTVVLEETLPLICLDGLDEVAAASRRKLETEITALARRLHNARILLTTRSGDFRRNIEAFDVLEIKPLTDEQIDNIAHRCMKNAEKFLESVRSSPYVDATRRPLALFQLIVLYRNYGELAEQPSSVYQKLVSLYLEEWDFHNRVERSTKYKNLPVNRKYEFIASLAHFLLYQSGSISYSFSEKDLKYAYSQLHESFRLPKDECADVVAEIETHTGIIRQTGTNVYEFADASQQEFLAAHYLSKDPFSETLLNKLSRHPGPIAITVALATDPSKWLAHLFLHEANFGRTAALEPAIPEFLRRVRIERPYFAVSGLLGYVFIKLAMDFVHDDEICSELVEVSKDGNIDQSLKRAISAYSVVESTSDEETVVLKLNRTTKIGDRLVIPDCGRMRRSFYGQIISSVEVMGGE